MAYATFFSLCLVVSTALANPIQLSSPTIGLSIAVTTTLANPIQTVPPPIVSTIAVTSTLANPVQIRSSPINLPVAVKVNLTGGAPALIERDRARARAFFSRGEAKAKGRRFDVPVPVTDAGQLYTADVGVGAGTYTLIVDTGSSNTWVGAGQSYQPGANTQDTGESVSVSYGSGSFMGEEFIDDVTLGPATIFNQSIGVASSSQGFDGFDGILGLGPDDLTAGTTSGGGTIPTVTDNLVSQGTIDTALVGVSFVPTTSVDDLNGELDFGAADSSKFLGDISFVPVTNTSPASKFWGIDQSITYGLAGVPILPTTAGIVDTGTTLLLLATEAFQAYQLATGAALDQDTGLLTVSDPNSLQSLFFSIGGTAYEFTSNAQIWPRALNEQIGGQPGTTYLIVSDNGTPLGQGLDFTNGFVFLQRFYSVYDTANGQVGLATTPHTHDISN